MENLQTATNEVIRFASPAVVMVGNNGSGVIVSPQGTILTASHVIGIEDSEMTIRFADGHQEQATVVKLDRDRDTATLQLNGAGDYPSLDAELDDAPTNEFQAGTWCIALGYPYSMRSGRQPLPRLGRITGQQPNGKWITDCTLMGGDSGGPLLDAAGRLIGIHSSVKLEIGENLHVPLSQFATDFDPNFPMDDPANVRSDRNEPATAAPPRTKMTVGVQRHFSALAKQSAPAIVRLIDLKRRSIFGTMISTDGLVITKASAIGRSGRCVLHNGKATSFRKVATDESLDLAVIKIRSSHTQPIFRDIASTKAVPDSDQFPIVCVPRPDGTIAGWGIAGSIAHRSLNPITNALNANALSDADAGRWGGGPWSRRRFDFGTVITHDTVLDPGQCGGPLISLGGKLIGINISRSLRVASFAIPIDEVAKMVRRKLPTASTIFDDVARIPNALGPGPVSKEWPSADEYPVSGDATSDTSRSSR